MQSGAWTSPATLGLALTLCGLAGPGLAAEFADTVYVNGNVVTMDRNRPDGKAIAVKGETILAVGTTKRIERFVGPDTKTVDLEGATVLPGFIDPHSHFLGYAGTINERWIDVSNVNVYFKPPPGDPRCLDPTDPQKCFIPVRTQQDVIDRLTKAAQAPGAKSVYAFNYDTSRLGNSGPHCPGPKTNVGFACPNLEDGHARATLDAISTKIPIYVTGESGHVAYVNTKALTELNICGTDVAGANCREPFSYPLQQRTLAQAGQLVEDLALYGDAYYVGKVFSENPPGVLESILRAADIYAAHGYTLIQEGAADVASAKLYLDTMKVDPAFPMTVGLYMYSTSSGDFADTIAIAKQTKKLIKGNDDIFIAGLKSFADGGLPIYTAHLSRPYLEVFPPFTGAVFPNPYMGMGDLTTNAMKRRTLMAHEAGYPILIHELGDRAGRDVVHALAAAERQAPSKFRDIVLHGPFLTDATLAKIKEFDSPVSFLASDLYFWGLPLCQQLVGKPFLDRFRPYPARSARKAGLRVTLHTDSPVTPPDPLFSVWVAKTRRAQQPEWYANSAGCPLVIAPEESLTIREGIEAWTINAAWQYGRLGEMGTITPGKLANLVLMSDDPLSMEDDPDGLKTIRILATVHKGRYRANPTADEPPIWPGD